MLPLFPVYGISVNSGKNIATIAANPITIGV